MSTPVNVFAGYDWSQLPPPRTVSLNQFGTGSQLITGTGLVIAVSLAEMSGTAAARVQLHDTSTGAANLILPLAVPANGFCSPGIGSPGIPYRSGLFLQWITGLFSAAITYIPLLNLPE